MIALHQYHNKWQLIPQPARFFLLRALGLLMLWKFVYLAFLLPARVIDAPLTHAVSKATAYTLNLVSGSATQTFTTKEVINKSQFEGTTTSEPVTTVYLNNRRTLSVGDPCNGLELFVLYAGFIFCLPATKWRKTIFITGGVLSIWIINVLRCVALIYVYLYNPKYTNFSHHYLFKFLVYGFIFCLWLLYSKKLAMNDKAV